MKKNVDEKWVNVPFSQKDHRAIAIAAAEAGMSVCRYVAQLATDAIKRR